MGKKFKILQITLNNQFGKLFLADVNNETDQRALHIEPVDWADNIAKGIEMSGDYRVLAGSGYLLSGEKPISDWSVDDIVEELFFPETLDSR